MNGIAAPHPLRRHGLPVAGLAAVTPLVAARDGGGNAGGPGVAHVASSSASTSPDPEPYGGAGGRGGVDLRRAWDELNSPRVKAAQQACRHCLGLTGTGS